MFKNLLKLNALVALFIVGFMTSCSDDDSDVQVENYVIETTYELQKAHMIGRPGCFELVFPVTIEFPDATTAEVDSYENMKETIRAWKEANVDNEDRPQLVYPIDVINEDGEVITVTDKTELIELKRECRKEFMNGPRDHHHRGKFKACFDLVYPLSIALPDGTEVVVNDVDELKTTLRDYKENNPGSTERPQLVYPIEIQFEDGTTQTINSKEELREAKKECRE
ncbi:MAG: hypothetical protein HKN67_07525 [Saprospiraceae bacterium]|nr:hypothetical protein [Saprospiraceae bacterium]